MSCKDTSKTLITVSFIVIRNRKQMSISWWMDMVYPSIEGKTPQEKSMNKLWKHAARSQEKKKSTYSVILYIKFFSMQIDLKWCKKKKRICCCLGVKNGKVWKGGVTKAQGNWGADWLTVSMVVMVSQMYTCVKAIKLYTLNTSTWSKRGAGSYLNVH